MKSISKTNLLSIVFLLTNSFFISFCGTQKNESLIELQWKNNNNLEQEEEIFICSFLKAYENESEETLGVEPSKKQWLEDTFKEERNDFKKKSGEVFIVSAKKNSKVVGFASFNETKNEGEIYIRQLAVDPDHWGEGIGKALVFSINDNEKIGNINKFVLVTRRCNIGAKDFYIRLGFTETKYCHEGLDPKKYVGYEFVVKEK